MNNNYILLRHGETPYQLMEERIVYPWPEPEPIHLTPNGRAMIKKAAEYLKKEDIDLIYSSDIPRAVESAEIVSDILGKPVNFESALREINLGIYRGGPLEKYKEEIEESANSFSKVPEGGESEKECRERVAGFYKRMEEEHKGKNILIISHGAPLFLLSGTMLGFKETDFQAGKHKSLKMKVGDINRIRDADPNR
jgi:broad specificity phosphatase PhoE